MNSKLVLLLITLSCQSAASQNSLELTYGLRHYQRQDLTFSPLIFKGTAPINLGMSYQRTGEKLQTKVHIDLAGFACRSVAAFEYSKWDEVGPLTVPPSNFWMIGMGVDHLRQIRGSGRPMTWYAGLSLRAQLGALFYEFGEYGAFGYTTVAALSPSVAGVWKMSEKNSLHFSLSLPLFNWIARSPYAINDDEFIERQSNHRAMKTLLRLSGDGHWASLGQVQAGTFSVKFNRTFHAKWALSLGYDFSLLRAQDPHPLTAMEQGLVLGIAKHW